MTAPFLLILKIDAWNSEARVHLIHYTAVQCMEGLTTEEGEEALPTFMAAPEPYFKLVSCSPMAHIREVSFFRISYLLSNWCPPSGSGSPKSLLPVKMVAINAATVRIKARQEAKIVWDRILEFTKVKAVKTEVDRGCTGQ